MSGKRGQWTLNYRPDNGGRVLGEFSVTDEEVRFRALYDASLLGYFFVDRSVDKTASAGDLAQLSEDGSEIEIILPKALIAKAEAAKKGMTKRVVISLKDGRKFIFDYGLLSVKKIVEAIPLSQ